MMNHTWVEKVNNALTKQRISYAWIAGSVLWIAWLFSVLTGPKGFDRSGQVLGTDYIQFYAAGRTLLNGESEQLYDFKYQSTLEAEIIGPGLSSYHAFITPPLFAVLFLPLSLLPYPISFAIWSLLSFFFLGFSIALLNKRDLLKTYLWSLLWFPVFASISFGQNSLLSMAIISLSFLGWKEKKYFLSGLITGLLFYKPQLIIGFFVLFILDHRIQLKSLAGFIISTLAIIAINVLLFPGASSAYLNFVIYELPSMISQDQFPIWHMHTIRGFWTMLLGNQRVISEILYALSIGVISIGFIKFFQRHQLNRMLIFASALCFTLLITPHAMIYDWSLLLIPAILLMNQQDIPRQDLRVIFAIMWFGAFLSGPLSYLQLKFAPIALQISIPIFIFSAVWLYNHLMVHHYKVDPSIA